MMERIDYLRDEETNDLLIADGDFVRGDASFQHIRHIILSEPGENRHFPTLAAGATGAVNGATPALIALKNTIRAKLTEDGFRVNRISIEEGNISVKAT